jgi:hypothetical protein
VYVGGVGRADDRVGGREGGREGVKETGGSGEGEECADTRGTSEDSEVATS